MIGRVDHRVGLHIQSRRVVILRIDLFFQKLSARQKELLKEFGELSGDNVNPEQKSFMDTLKDLFR